MLVYLQKKNPLEEIIYRHEVLNECNFCLWTSYLTLGKGTYVKLSCLKRCVNAPKSPIMMHGIMVVRKKDANLRSIYTCKRKTSLQYFQLI